MAAQSSSGRPGRRRRAHVGGPVERSEPQPLDVDGVGAALVGTVAWVIALVAMLPFYGTLRDDGRDWWIWTCLAGIGLGLIGFEYCRRRRTALRRPAGDPASADASPLTGAPEDDPSAATDTREMDVGEGDEQDDPRSDG